jgi:hypothetical protein
MRSACLPSLTGSYLAAVATAARVVEIPVVLTTVAAEWPLLPPLLIFTSRFWAVDTNVAARVIKVFRLLF